MEKYSKLGNVNYTPSRIITCSRGLLKTPSLALKLYEMANGRDISEFKTYDSVNYAEAFAEFLKREIDREKIEPLSGMGFSILSKDMLNVARWDDKYPIVLKNQIYGFKKAGTATVKEQLESIKPLDIRGIGSFCIWELGIVHHERNAWKDYLQSGMKEEDKEKYLNSTIEGLL